MSAARVPVIGIVGGIGSGKSSVALALASKFRCCRLDADKAGHQALKQPEIQQKLRNTFGADVFDPQGQVHRPALAERVFGSAPNQQLARHQLEEIVHPEIRMQLESELRQFQSQDNCDLILLDAALLLEAGWSELCNAIVYVDVPEAVRWQRVESRGWTNEQFRRREASQLSLEQKRQRSDFVVENSGDLSTTTLELVDWIIRTFPQIGSATHSQ